MTSSPFPSRAVRSFLLSVACLGLVALTGCEDPRGEAFSTLQLTPDELVFPRLAPGSSEDRTFVVENIGDSELKLANFATDLPEQFSIYYTRSGDDRELVGVEGGRNTFPQLISLRPGERLTVIVNYLAAGGRVAPGVVAMDASDPDHPEVRVNVTVLGGGPVLDLSPGRVDVGRVPAGQTATGNIRATNIGTEVLLLDDIRVDGSANFDLAIGDESIADAGDPAALWADPDGDGEPGLAPGAGFDIEVRYTATADVFDEALAVFRSNDEVEVRTVPLAANGATPCVRITPATLEFGAALIGRDTPKRITIESCGGEPLRLDGIELTNDGGGAFALDDDSLPPLPSQLPAQVMGEAPPSRGITVVFSPEAEQIYEGRLLIATNDTATPEVEVPLIGRGTLNECPVARVVEEDYTVLPLDVITLDASTSTDTDGPDGRPVRYQWTVVQRPEGSTAMPVEQFDNPVRPADGGRPDSEATPTAQFFVDLAGDYVIELRVVDNLDAAAPSEACPQAPAQVRIHATPDEDIHVQLVWDTPGDPDQTDNDGSDVDVWFLHPSAVEWVELIDRLRCYYGNPNPDWGMSNNPDDDPSLDIDDVSGAGPENINLNNPENTQQLGGAYRVGVHYYRSWQETGGGGEYGPSLVTVRIYLGGAVAYEGERELFDSGDFWEVASIVWTPGDRRVQPINRFSELPPP